MKKKLTFVMFIDAFGWEVLKRNKFMEEELPFRKKMNTVFGYSCTAIPTILTGKTPSVHKHFSFFFHSEKSPFAPLKPLGYLPEFIAGRGRVRAKMSNIIRRFYGYTGYFQLYNVPFQDLDLFDYCEKTDMYKPGAMAPCDTLFDTMVKEQTPYYVSDWRQSEKYNIAEMEEVLKEGKVRLAYLYTAAMDSLLHQKGKEHSDIAEKIAFYEKHLRNLLTVARESYEDVDIVIFSDHGMNTIHETVDLMSEVAATKLKFREDYVAVFDSTMARFWFKSDDSREKIEKVLKSLNYGRILTDDELKDWGCHFEDGQYGELFFLLDPGVLMVPSHMGKTALTGMHGYDPTCADAYAMMVSNRPIGEDVKGLNHIRQHIESLVHKENVECDDASESNGEIHENVTGIDRERKAA